MSYSNFWTEFDDRFNPSFVLIDDNGTLILGEDGKPKRRIDQDIRSRLMRVLQLDKVFVRHYDRSTGKLNVESFSEQAVDLNISEDIKVLIEEQLKIINQYFTIGENNLRDAFEYFGQGSLYDSTHDSKRMKERPGSIEFVPYRIHMADGPAIYGRWHSFIRFSLLLGIELEEKAWTELDRLIALAYMIQYAVGPIQSFQFPGGDTPENIPYKQTNSWRVDNIYLIESWRSFVSKANLEELDRILGKSYFNESPLN